MVSRRQRKQGRKNKIMIVGIAILIIGLAVSMFQLYSGTAVPASAGEDGRQSFEFGQLWPKWRDIIFAGVPLLQNTVEQEPAVKVTPEFGMSQMLRRAVAFLTNIDFGKSTNIAAILDQKPGSCN